MFKVKPKKIKNEVKINIIDNCIVKNKKATKVFKIKDIRELESFLDNVKPDVRLKILINYKTNTFLVFKTGELQKKKKGTVVEIKENQLNSKELTALYKSFYSSNQLNNGYNDTTYEIAPKEFILNADYIKTEDRYLNVVTVEHIDSSCRLQEALNKIDSWLSIDCYKVNSDFILNTLEQMDADETLEKNFTGSITTKLDDLVKRLEQEVIFQTEIKILNYNTRLKQLKSDAEDIIDTLYNNYSSGFISFEKCNTRRNFEKAIYPNVNMDVVNSINLDNLISIIGGVTNV